MNANNGRDERDDVSLEREQDRATASVERQVREAFRPGVAGRDALDRVRAEARARSVDRASEREHARPRRSLAAGLAVAAVVVAVAAVVLFAGSLRTPEASVAVQRALELLDATVRPGRVTHEIATETRTEVGDAATKTTTTTTTESWRTYEGEQIRVERRQTGGGQPQLAELLVVDGTHAMEIRMPEGERPAVTESFAEHPDTGMLHYRYLGPCESCHPDHTAIVPSEAETTSAAPKDDGSVFRDVLERSREGDVSRQSIDGVDCYVLETSQEWEGGADGKTKMRQELSVYIDARTYRITGGSAATYEVRTGPDKLVATYELEVVRSEALDPVTLPAGFFTPTLPMPPFSSYGAAVRTRYAADYDRFPLYWLGPEVAGEPWVPQGETARPFAGFGVSTAEDPGVGSEPGSPVGAVQAQVDYRQVGKDGEAAPTTGGVTVMTFASVTPEAMMQMGGGQRTIATQVGGRTVTLVQSQSADPAVTRGSGFPWWTTAFFVHFPDATVRVVTDGPVSDALIEESVRRLWRAN